MRFFIPPFFLLFRHINMLLNISYKRDVHRNTYISNIFMVTHILFLKQATEKNSFEQRKRPANPENRRRSHKNKKNRQQLTRPPNTRPLAQKLPRTQTRTPDLLRPPRMGWHRQTLHNPQKSPRLPTANHKHSEVNPQRAKYPQVTSR